MTNRSKFIISLMMIFAIFIFTLIYVLYDTLSNHQHGKTSKELLNQYYQTLPVDSDQARNILTLILKKNPHDISALKALAYLNLQQGEYAQALKILKLITKIKIDDREANKALNYLYRLAMMPVQTFKVDMAKQWHSGRQQNFIVVHKPKEIVKHIFDNNMGQWLTSFAAIPVLPFMAIERHPINEKKHHVLTKAHLSIFNLYLNKFYNNRVKDPKIADHYLRYLLRHYPNNIRLLKEAAYFYLNQAKTDLAINYFQRAYCLTNDSLLALQLAYLYDKEEKKRLAYYYFDRVSDSSDYDLKMKGELGAFYLRGMQTKFLPFPYFANILYYPMHQSHFNLMIQSFIARAGIVLNKYYRFAVYIIHRYTKDNRSGGGVISQVYDDNSSITAFGAEIQPIETIPFVFFLEAGRAKDLIDMQRGRWRNDLRFGFFYYNEWGKKPRYTDNLAMTLTPNLDVYADGVYFSRYLNTIATLRLRPGIEIIRFKNSVVNLYYKGFISQNSKREFYNNIAEYGPGISFQPTERFNLVIRFESLSGNYLSHGRKSLNPYGKKYRNNVIFLETYLEF